MKKILIFGLFFALGACVLLGGTLIVTDIMHGRNALAGTAYIDASVIEPASGAASTAAETKNSPSDHKTDLVPPLEENTAAVEDISATHPILRLTPDKTEMVTLDRDAQSVVVGNPDHASVLMENPRLLLFVPRKAGATHVSILDREGNIIMQRHVIVSAPREKYVRIRRSCANASRQGDCKPVSVYYCPDMCHEVSVDANTGQQRR
jgi:Flp pilus assembly secretin CpaC